MFTKSEKDWILEAINHLKGRKARPDFSRISLRMKRKHQLTITQTRQLLDSLVESGIVVKAVYKNNTSYRDVSKWKKGKLGGQILNSSRMLQRFVKAITSKQSSDLADDGKCTGVSAKEIEEWISHGNEDKCFLSGAALRDAIENEVNNGYLKKVDLNNESFYSVNTDKVDVNIKIDSSEVEEVDVDLEAAEVLDSLRSTKREYSSFVSGSSQQDDHLETSNDFNNLRMAIYETEEERGNGSTLMNIEHWMKTNQTSMGSFLKDNRTLLLEFLKSQVNAGFIKEAIHENVTFYSVNDKALFDGDSFGLCNNSSKSVNSIDDDEQARKRMKLNNLPLEMSSMQSGRAGAVSLRPPSKRKRIQKDHGPDFETELPTKSKAKLATGSREYSFPTPLDSPVSEKSETYSEQNFKFDQKKKRGRPKKGKSVENDHIPNGHMEVDIDVLEGSKSNLGGHSEQSSVCQEGNEDCMSEAALPDASAWTSEQVADYFLEQGYEEESKQMLENELDGAALCLLRRSDIVGPPAGGMLKIKKLGVALKLFRDIRNLLYQGNADNYEDPYEERAFYRS